MTQTTAQVHDGAWTARSALRFVLLFGIVSLFADFAYEGARSVNGQFLSLLGASGFAVGFIAGAGELLGYALRLVSGRAVDRTRWYWPIAIAGYLIQMAAIPALALAGSWQAAAVLIIAERAGKAVRKPATGVMLAGAGERIGRGWAFGLYEGLDQLGALLGPLLVSLVLLERHQDYHLAFAWLGLPALLTVLLVLAARLRFAHAGTLQVHPHETGSGGGYPAAFWWYLAGAGLVGFGFADFPLIAYHFTRTGSVAAPWVPVFYAAAMGAGGAASVLFGRLYDRRGLGVLVPLTLLLAANAPLVFFGGFAAALAGSLLWGIGLGVHESMMSAAVAALVPRQRLGAAYGLFTAVFGLAWFAGSAALGALYDVSVQATVIAAVAAQVLALPLLWSAARRMPRAHA
jgi:predicted MFS family arabinose efflux permease